MFREIQTGSFNRLSSLRKLRESLLLTDDSMNKSDNLSRSIHLYTIQECVRILATEKGIMVDESIIYEAESELAKCLSISMY